MQRPNHLLAREIFERRIKIKLSFIRKESYFRNVSQLFYYHWVSSPEFLKLVHSAASTLHLLSQRPYTENIILFLKTSLLRMANILLLSISHLSDVPAHCKRGELD